VGCGGATGALTRGWEAADDGGQELRRSSGEAWRSERRKRSRMGVRECKSESVGSSGMCFKSRRRHGEREQVRASRRRAWRLGRRRRDVVRGGEKPAEAGQAVGAVAGGHVARRGAAWG
jgi:hypothetical protein